MKTHGHSLNDELFHALMTEVEAILNPWTLTVETLMSAVTSPYHWQTSSQ